MRTPAVTHVWPRFLLLAALVATGCSRPDDGAPAPVVTVTAANPVRGPIAEQITADAVLAPLAEAAISPRISAPIRAEFVQRGDRVRRGQLLIALDARDLEGSARESRGTLAAAQANYAATTRATIPEDLQRAQLDADQLKVAAQVAESTMRERQKLFEQGALSGRDVDTARAAAAAAQAAYATAQAHVHALEKTTSVTQAQAAGGQLTEAQGRLENAAAQVSFAQLRSPIAGVVTERPYFPGETAPAGATVATVMDTSSLLAKLHLAQAAAQKLALGDKAHIEVPGMDQPVAASISFISPALDPGSTTVELWLKLPNADGRLKVGTPVHAILLGTTVRDALEVPASSIVPGDDGSTHVMLVGADGAAHTRAVRVGIRTPETVQILSGLAASDRVISTGGYGLDDGTKVEVSAHDDDSGGEKP